MWCNFLKIEYVFVLFYVKLVNIKDCTSLSILNKLYFDNNYIFQQQCCYY